MDPCNYEDKEVEGTMVGSKGCQECRAFYGIDYEKNWVKCLNYGLHCAEADGNQKEKEKLLEAIKIRRSPLFYKNIR